MAFTIADRVLDTTTSTASPFALSGIAPAGYKTFLTGIGNSNTCYYTIQNPANGEWESGTATLTGGTTLTRVTLIGSSTGSAVTFSAGTKYIFVALPASKNVYLDNSDVVNVAGDVTATSHNGGQLAGMRNVIINGDCRVAQYGPTDFSDGVTGCGEVDRFSAKVVGAGICTQSRATLIYQNKMLHTVRQRVLEVRTSFPSASTQWSGIRQTIEGFNCSHMVGNPTTLSFLFNTNVTGTYTVSISIPKTLQFYVTTFTATANTASRIVLKIPSIPITWSGDFGGDAVIISDINAGLVINIGGLASGGVFATANLNNWVDGGISPICATTATNWGTTLNNFIELTELQLELGSVNTPFERRSIALETSLCERYYQTNNFKYSGYGASTGADSLIIPINLATRMRITPVFTTIVGTLINVINVTYLSQMPNSCCISGTPSTVGVVKMLDSQLMFSAEFI